MFQRKKTNISKSILALHCTDKSFGFGLKELNNNNFQNNPGTLSNNLIYPLNHQESQDWLHQFLNRRPTDTRNTYHFQDY